MGRVNTAVLSDLQRTALENEVKKDKNHAFRMGCQSILLKADNRTSKDVGMILGMTEVNVNSWLKR